ncbi:MAG: PEP-CTERM sorting domain-containing protein [Alphaproteobacteria bacterium]|nr:PEP-CTERM sorting domain-containing protein [Alphaproteobacteria bacterium]
MSFAAAAAALALSASPASATIFYSNYTPSDTAASTVGVGLPLTRRTPDGAQSFDTAASSSTYCANIYCTFFYGDTVTTSFTVDSTFTASHMIVPIATVSPYGNRRSGFNIEKLEGADWVGLGFMQVESGLVPGLYEVQVAFGNSSGSTFNPAPINFEAGETYRIRTNHAAGAAGYLSWYLSDTAAADGQSYQYSTAPGAAGPLAYQPAFALTDGGALTFPANSAAPEPGTWALMLGGFLGAGAMLRRDRRRLARG